MRRLGSWARTAGPVLLAAATGLGLAAPAGAQEPPSAVTVSMKEFEYRPPTVTVALGGTVTWTYDEEATDVAGCESPLLQTVPGVMCPGHSVTAVDKGPDGQPLFDSGLHRADGFPYSFRFDAPGTYRYFCVVHGGDNANNPLTAMNGEVVVPGAPVVAPLTPTPAGTGGAAPGTGGVEVQGAALARSGGAGPVGPTVAAALLVLALLLRRRVVDP